MAEEPTDELGRAFAEMLTKYGNAIDYTKFDAIVDQVSVWTTGKAYTEMGKATMEARGELPNALSFGETVSKYLEEIFLSPLGDLGRWGETTFDRMKLSESMKSLVEEMTSGPEAREGVITSLVRAGIAILTYVQYVRHIVSFAGQEAQYGLSRRVQIIIPEPGDVLRYAWRTEWTDELKDHIRAHGISDKFRELVEAANRPILDVSTLVALEQRSCLDGYRDQFREARIDTEGKPLAVAPHWDAFSKHLARLGYDEKARKNIAFGVAQPVGVGEIFELLRRGKITSEEFQSALQFLGYRGYALHYLPELVDRLVDPLDLRTMLFRKKIDKGEYIAGLRKHGFTEADADLIHEISPLLPQPADLIRFGLREVFTPEVAARFGQFEDFPERMVPWGEAIGLKREVMQLYWAAHWDLPSPGQGFSMFHRGIISHDDLEMLLRALDVMPFWRDRLIQLSYNLIPRRALRGVGKYQGWGLTELTERFAALGYSPSDAGRFADATLRDIYEPETELSRAELLTSYKWGIIDADAVRGALRSMRYADRAIDHYLALAELTRSARQRQAVQGTDEQSTQDIVNLTRSDIVAGYVRGIFDEPTVREKLDDLGYSNASIDYYIQRGNLDRDSKGRDVSARQLRAMLANGVLSEADAISELVRSGYDPVEARNLVRLWVAELAAEAEERKGRLKEPSKVDLKRWLLAGVITPEQWTDEMTSLGYRPLHVGYYWQDILIGLME